MGEIAERIRKVADGLPTSAVWEDTELKVIADEVEELEHDVKALRESI